MSEKKSYSFWWLLVILLVAVVFLGSITSNFLLNKLADVREDSIVLWEGRYDSLVKRSNEVNGEIRNLDINMWADKDSVYALVALPSFGVIPLYKKETLSLNGIIRWRSMAYPVRRSRHRVDCEQLNKLQDTLQYKNYDKGVIINN
jgi:hypothetical protein